MVIANNTITVLLTSALFNINIYFTIDTFKIEQDSNDYYILDSTRT